MEEDLKMNYLESLDYIHSVLKFGVKLGLDNIKYLLNLMGNPHEKLKFIHIAGTNGKGSTAAFISSILIESGYKVGLYTSPYIERFTERIKINNLEISENDISKIITDVKYKIDKMLNEGMEHPSEFEIITAVAFQYFYEIGCEVVVLEVGLGGRYDATNVIDAPLVSVITTISFDHTEQLGNTLPQIAFEKAGIIKENSDVILYGQQSKEIEEVFETICIETTSNINIVNFENMILRSYGIDGQIFDYGEHRNLRISLLGDHQIKNAIMALEAVSILKNKGFNLLNNDTIRSGLEKSRWSARLEIINKQPLFLIDGAHNLEGAKTLVEALLKYFKDKRKIFIIGTLKDKDFKQVIELVSPLAYKFITVTPNSDRALSSVELAKYIKPYSKDVLASSSIEEAVTFSLSLAQNDDIICAFGSLYYIGEIRKIFLGE